MARAALSLLGLLALAAAAGAQVAFEPTPGVVYKLEGDLATENWSFALRVPARPHALTVVHRAGGEVLHTERLRGAALAARFRAGRIQDLYYQLPAAASADRIDVVAHELSGRQHAASARLERYVQRNRYTLPVRGTWFVSSGHDFGVEHRRHLSRGHFAWDLVVTDAAGRTSSGPHLEQHFAFGAPVLAPADGTVLEVVGDCPDNPPGHPTERANFVLIDHGGGELCRLAHLKRGSVRVRAGQRVRRGEVVAQVGNSGMSEEPHLHVGFERHDRGSGREQSDPVPVQFSGYTVRWNQGTRRVERGRPRRGQWVLGSP